MNKHVQYNLNIMDDLGPVKVVYYYRVFILKEFENCSRLQKISSLSKRDTDIITSKEILSQN